ncbi:SWIB-domain-containing protein [Conidiobolus coronatus NRRL 28638]|uniref:SWIB-domain-containing protein n=1 Tax=Conidiobolus coronatus (strain ATCC 28846 / CBS 209.66 / NRRL 28638) TaxID=796925 RepID=A0A137P7R5_CONC2|nr:SWIB-domain-containing protein [Conidiobolus coronatus NRRL 28638]|eukprot:KXN71057.1 SWIB-domain-containing protein [Conidiobolus coronatus NRRL 28638]
MNYNSENINGQMQQHINNNGSSQGDSIKAKKMGSIDDFSKKYRLVYLPIIQHILNNSNLETITIKKIRAELEDRLEFEFIGEEKDLIKQLIVFIFDEFVTLKQMEAEEESESEFGSTKKTPKKRKATKKKSSSNKEDKPKVKRTGGINVPLRLSEQMAEFAGVTQLSRPQIVKKVWEYIKANDLQEPTNRNKINNDSKLEALFGVKDMTAFGMAKLISPHVSKLEPHEIIKADEGSGQQE